MTIALPLIGELAVWLVVLWMVAIALAIAVILDYIAGKLHGLPFPLNQLAGPVHSLAQGISSVAYGAIKTSEKVVGASFHLLAQFWDKLWNEVKSHAVAIAEAATIIGLLVNAYHLLRALVRHSVGKAEALLPRIKALEREWKGIEHGVKDLTKMLLAFGGIDALIHMLRNLHGLRDWVKGELRPINTAIDGLRGSLADLKRFLGIRNGLSYLEWAAGIVAAVIGIEALNLFRCSTFQNKTVKRGCGLWDGLEKLLGLAGLLAVGFTFQEFVDAAETVAGGIGSFVGDLEKPFVGDLPPLPPPRT